MGNRESGPRHVHFLGICGYAVSGAALLAQELGYVVTGSDEDAYPPTSDVVDAAGIPWRNEHLAGNLDVWGRPDLVVVGNQVRAGNAEWQAAVERGVPVTSEAEFYVEMTRDRVRVAVCGTHGKTTTAALLAHMLGVAGMDPGLRLGSTSRDFGVSARLGSGPFVFEGDEYTTAPWDSRPKFLHTHPHAACVTRLELDHPDVYADFDDYRAPFVEMVSSLPAAGVLALCADDADCLRLGDDASCPTAAYGDSEAATWRTAPLTDAGDALLQRFSLRMPGRGQITIGLGLPGLHNRQNATAALILALHVGAPLASCVAACASFRGVSRRFEVCGVAAGVTVVDDYAHHPTEVAATLAAARSRYPGGVHVVYVPHTYSRTLALIEDYTTSFRDADTVVLGPIEVARERALEGTVSSYDVAERARRSCADVRVVASAAEAIGLVRGTAQSGDVVLCLSVRGFDGIAGRLLETLRAR